MIQEKRSRGRVRGQGAWRSPRHEGIRPMQLALILLVCAAVAAGAYFLQEHAGLEPKTAENTVRLNEIMSENQSTLITDAGEAPDWIEITNVGGAPVELGAWALMLDSRPNRAFVFPAYSLQPGETKLVYAGGAQVAADEWRAPFRLSASGGEQLALLDARGRTVDMVTLPELKADEAYIRTAGGWKKTGRATPGAANDGGAVETGVRVVKDAVELCEAMSGNTLYFADENGECHDYVEIRNTGARDVDLAGWYLSDSSEKLRRWAFPEMTLPAGAYLAVHLSGYDRSENPAHLHANFRLSGAGEHIYLSRPDGQAVSALELPALEKNQAWSLVDGVWDASLAPTPNRANTAECAAETSVAAFGDRSAQICLNEIMASPVDQEYDWVEVYNGSSAAVDLSGYGLSDDTAKPRKWQFPAGTVVQPHAYLGVYCSGRSEDTLGGYLNADFALSAQGGYTLSLSDPQGGILDAVYLPEQYGGVSYGRSQGESGFFFFETATPGAENAGAHSRGRARMAECSRTGGVFSAGERFNVELSAAAGARIYYTLDCSEPNEGSMLYSGPIPVSDTTILRYRVYQDGRMPSLTGTQSYLYGVNNASGVWVVSLVADRDDLVGERGILSNYLEDIEREGHVELFMADGRNVLSQGCGLSLHGRDSRKLPVKSFNVIARSEYGGNRFNYPIFAERDYESYQSILLRASGEDYNMSFMRDTVLSSLMKDSSLMYQKNEIAIVYLNGEYYTLCYIRERINKHSICQFEGWEGMEDEIDLVKGNSSVTQGSNASFETLLDWVKNNDTSTEAAYAYIGSQIDIQNYIEYMSIQIFTGNTDTLNVRRYRNARVDGKWRWALFDLDWAFFNDTDSIGNWLTPGGTGAGKRTDNTLFIACMRNPRFREEFLTYFGKKMATDFSTENVMSKFEERYRKIEGVLPQYLEKWGINLNAGIKKVVSYARERPAKLLGYFQAALQLSNADMEKYFGETIEEMQEDPIWEAIEEAAEGVLGEGEF